MLIPPPPDRQEVEFLVRKEVLKFIEEFEKALNGRLDDVLPRTNDPNSPGMIKSIVIDALQEVKSSRIKE